MAHNDGQESYLQRLLSNEIVMYYTDAPYIHRFRELDINSESLLLQMMDDFVQTRTHTNAFTTSLEQVIDTIKHVSKVSSVPVNYTGEVISHGIQERFTTSRREPNYSLNTRYASSDKFYCPVHELSSQFVMKNNGLYSPLSFALSEKIYPVADAILTRTDLDINGNHSMECPHPIDFMDEECILEGLLYKMISRADFNSNDFENDIMILLNNTLDSNQLLVISNALKIAKFITENEKFSLYTQKESECILKKGKTKIDFII